MNCALCQNWITRRLTLYGDGSEVVRFESPEHKGQCVKLNIETEDTFGCSYFSPGDEHAEIERKANASWQNWRMGPCPDCSGRGSNGSACYRCIGTGNVRYYDDGYIGTERLRDRPDPNENLVRPGHLRRLVVTTPTVDPGTILQPLKAEPATDGGTL